MKKWPVRLAFFLLALMVASCFAVLFDHFLPPLLSAPLSVAVSIVLGYLAAEVSR